MSVNTVGRTVMPEYPSPGPIGTVLLNNQNPPEDYRDKTPCTHVDRSSAFFSPRSQARIIRIPQCRTKVKLQRLLDEVDLGAAGRQRAVGVGHVGLPEELGDGVPPVADCFVR